MGQVPANYGIVGSGRLATHLKVYFDYLNIPYKSWSRSLDTNQSIKEALVNCQTILLAISDGAIENFCRQNPFLQDKTLVHFSGSLSLPGISSCHPLTTFGPEPYNQQSYIEIPFIYEVDSQDEAKKSFREIFPDLNNQQYPIDSQKKSLYHAICVLSGNFSQILWKKAFTEFETTLDLPKTVLFNYLTQTSMNLLSSPEACLTGPLARNDEVTIARNLSALDNDPFQPVYQSFCQAFQSIGQNTSEEVGL